MGVVLVNYTCEICNITSAYVQYTGSLAEAINAAFSREVDSVVSL